MKMWWSHGKVNLTSSDREWNHVKFAFRCSALLGVTVKDHLIKTHYMGSNFMAQSAFENLNAKHPIRRLLRPHNYGANSVNMAASRTLSTSLGLVHRATALTEDALMTGLEVSWRLSDIAYVHDFESSGMIDTIKSRPELYPYVIMYDSPASLTHHITWKNNSNTNTQKNTGTDRTLCVTKTS